MDRLLLRYKFWAKQACEPKELLTLESYSSFREHLPKSQFPGHTVLLPSIRQKTFPAFCIYILACSQSSPDPSSSRTGRLVLERDGSSRTVRNIYGIPQLKRKVLSNYLSTFCALRLSYSYKLQEMLTGGRLVIATFMPKNIYKDYV